MANPDFIRFDLFPARVEVGDQIFDPSRTVVTDDSIIVFMDSSSGPVSVYEERLDDFSGNPKVSWIAEVDSGDTVKISRAGGCACGSRLRGFRPFPGVRHVPHKAF